MAAKKRWKRVAEQLAGRAAQHHAHSCADIGYAIFAIDGPEPADTALLIFLKQQACAFTLAADIGIHLELMKCPARHRHDAEDRNSEREYDREHMLEGNRVAPDHQCAADTAGKGNHPGHRALRNDDKAKPANSKSRHYRSGNHLCCGSERWAEIERKAKGRDVA